MASIRVVGPLAGATRGEAVASTLEVRFARPDFWWISRDERLVLLRDGRRHLVWCPEKGMMRPHVRESPWIPRDEIGGLGWGHPDLFLDPPAFQTPLYPPAHITVAGRDAWEVALSAPGKKPYVLRLAIDAETGLVVRYKAEGTPYITQVTHLGINDELPPDTFVFDGEVDERVVGRLDPAEQVEQLEGMLATYEALVASIERHVEVQQIIYAADDHEAAAVEIQRLLNISTHQARAVLDQRWQRFTEEQRRATLERRDALRGELERARRGH